LLLFMPLAIAMPLYAQAQFSMLRVACYDHAVQAQISINGKVKGECPIDLQVNPGNVRLKAFKKIDEFWEQSFVDEFFMGDGVVKKIEVKMSAPQLTAAAQQRAVLVLTDAPPTATKLISIAFAAFEGDPEAWSSFVRVMSSNMERSGRFRLIESGGTVMNESLTANVPHWKSIGADYVVGGSTAIQPDGRINVKFRAWNLITGASLGGMSLAFEPKSVRHAAHIHSDWLYEKITGTPGTFQRKKVEAVQKDGHYFLMVSDSDGTNPSTALKSPKPVALPMWSATGKHLAYLSMESGQPEFYVQELATGIRTRNPYSSSLLVACSDEITIIQGSGTTAWPQAWLKDGWAKNLSTGCPTSMLASLWGNSK